MDERSQKCRFALTVFDDTERLRSAINDFIAAGWSDNQLCLAGIRSALDAMSTSLVDGDLSHTGLTSLLTRVEERRMSADGPPIFASSGPILDEIARPPSSKLYGFHFPSHLPAPLARRIEAGAVALIVNSTSANQQDLSARILLRHAIHDILTHEFTPAPSSDSGH
jgi:hypothetical protein